MVFEFVGVNGISVEVGGAILDNVYDVLNELTGEKDPEAEGLSKEMCIKWAMALRERRDKLWTSGKDAEWKKWRSDFREGDEAFELGRFYQFLLNCGGIKAVVD